MYFFVWQKSYINGKFSSNLDIYLLMLLLGNVYKSLVSSSEFVPFYSLYEIQGFTASDKSYGNISTTTASCCESSHSFGTLITIVFPFSKDFRDLSTCLSWRFCILCSYLQLNSSMNDVLHLFSMVFDASASRRRYRIGHFPKKEGE